MWVTNGLSLAYLYSLQICEEWYASSISKGILLSVIFSFTEMLAKVLLCFFIGMAYYALAKVVYHLKSLGRTQVTDVFTFFCLSTVNKLLPSLGGSDIGL